MLEFFFIKKKTYSSFVYVYFFRPDKLAFMGKGKLTVRSPTYHVIVEKASTETCDGAGALGGGQEDDTKEGKDNYLKEKIRQIVDTELEWTEHLSQRTFLSTGKVGDIPQTLSQSPRSTLPACRFRDSRVARGGWGRVRPSESRLPRGTGQNRSSVPVVKTEKQRQQFQELVLGLVPKLLLKSLLGSWLNGARCLCPSPVGCGVNSRGEATSFPEDSHEQAGATPPGTGGKPKTDWGETSQSATPGSGSANTAASVSDKDDKVIKFEEDLKLDEVAEWASEMVSAY